MPRAVDYSGRRYGACVVVGRAPDRRRRDGTPLRMWRVRCDCGLELERAARDLPRTASCGCAGKHGLAGTRQYKIWARARGRCTNANDPAWANYGGRGIRMCGDWRRSFAAFWRDMAAGYADDLELDRIDNDKGYCPGNCRWVRRVTNVRNRRNTRMVEMDGVFTPVAVVAEGAGVPSNTIWWRWKRGVRGGDLVAHAAYSNRFNRRGKERVT